MGSALAEQMVREGVVRRSDVAIVERDATRLQLLRKRSFARSLILNQLRSRIQTLWSWR